MNIKTVNKKHNLYIIRVFNKEGSLVKLGYSSNIKVRLTSYYYANPLVELIGTYYREDAREFESLLHRAIKAEVLNEWYTEDKLPLLLDLVQSKVELQVPKYSEKTLDYETAVDLYFSYLEVGKFYDTTLGHKIHKKYLELLEMNLTLEQIKTTLKESAGNEKAYNRVVNGYRFRKSNTPQFANIRKHILTTFKKGDSLTSDKIFEVVSKTVIDNGGECKSKSKATEILNFLFETEEKIERDENSKLVRKLIIKLVK